MASKKNQVTEKADMIYRKEMSENFCKRCCEYHL